MCKTNNSNYSYKFEFPFAHFYAVNCGSWQSDTYKRIHMQVDEYSDIHIQIFTQVHTLLNLNWILVLVCCLTNANLKYLCMDNKISIIKTTDLRDVFVSVDVANF